MRTPVLGGIRSGKSRWAERTIPDSLAPGHPVRYLAPVAESDPAWAQEWAQRVAKHRERRPGHWSTVETDGIITRLRRPRDTARLVGDPSAWLTAAPDHHRAWDSGSGAGPAHDLVDAVSTFESTPVLVSPEVGLTVVSATASGRRFADELGSLNQRMAAICDQAMLVVPGQAVPIMPSRT
ncbi:cobinamide kinase / cobinamide phosphate guanyltransferase family protein [Mycobacterium kansasii 732]|uniref:Adenosylcobinamide kinase n=1 Tax=Mycobacterium pseudokansasii TaxID=2341080 RepID=A0A498QYN4_9MYCO|nr:bifunctional adenosylcobinamide kinase/adenosylcobinamide-phosphate guanylyltransferase [Mycobacterium pseudokansasii]EUA10875.1 cobinamide kinase / cobinamide phosphate guanyltransferase family protein [Mycobacterium kansasii 732]KZS68695.1 adenosylcobinamide kinase/adenosylcobinamide phosphate guanyltransferase [Mycobacterium kansasii]MBY0386797.1 bifunctional adenosylcobinamide kinase/adenosylcobinamide-phosphate guanylyltransferase [Mycobacterium pseudokansasii]VAZ97035.1 Bifunctional ad